LDDYRSAAMSSGDAHRGARLFADDRGRCTVCHSVDGHGGKVGPDLLGVADKFDRAGLIRAVLEPSADILPGYETTVVTTQSGTVSTGILRFSGDTQVELAGADGKPIRIARRDIDAVTISRISLMPENLQVQWTQAEFADLIAYLETLHLPPPTTAARPDNPDVIARAARPIRIVPFVAPEVGLHRPVWFGPLAGHPGSYLAVEVERARVWRIDSPGPSVTKQVFVDLHDQTRHGHIEGVLGFTLHPDFPKNRRYFVAMHDPAPDKVIMNIWEGRAADDGLSDSGRPPRKILSVNMPHINHNGCCLEFGPDGYLYIGLGDGGPQEDPNGYSQNLGSLLGKILRIDVGDGSGHEPYSIPASNPFRARDGARPEVWAFGLREPWRFTFDHKTGELWAGDVGQNRFEEVDVIKAGDNLGWNIFEGLEPFSNRYRRESERYVPPVLSYSHRHGVSVTGGYVYRGRLAPALEGMYVFGDFETRRVWGLTRENGKLKRLVQLGQSPSRIAAFGEDIDGELFIVGHDPHAIYRLDLSTADPSPTTVRELMATSERSGLLWRYTLSAPPRGWEAADFDDRSWTESAGGFGTRGTPGAIARTEWRTDDIWIRRAFSVSADDLNRLDPEALLLRIHHDEDAEVFVNGILAASPRGFIADYTELPISPAAARALRPGRNVIAIHCHQTTGGQYIDAGILQIRPVAIAKP
jgi:putative heme-binding domain-containing protein